MTGFLNLIWGFDAASMLHQCALFSAVSLARGCELWPKCLQALCDWIKAAGTKVCAFDFPTKGILQEAVRNTQYHRLRDREGRAPGLLGWWARRAVTFVDNHDTGGLEFVSAGLAWGWATQPMCHVQPKPRWHMSEQAQGGCRRSPAACWDDE